MYARVSVYMHTSARRSEHVRTYKSTFGARLLWHKIDILLWALQLNPGTDALMDIRSPFGSIRNCVVR